MYLIAVDTHRFVVFPQGSQGPLGTFPILLLLRVLHELLGVFVHAEISEVDKSLTDILGLDVVLVGRKSSQPLLEHVYAQGIIASYQDVDPEIVLEVVYQMRVTNIL
jgi:hypothetical protein